MAVITLNDGKGNALHNDRFRELNILLDKVDASEARCLVFRSGKRGLFSGGLDLKVIPKYSAAQKRAFLHLFPTTMERIYKFRKPTICLLNGHAIAGGCIMALACDRIYAAAPAERQGKYIIRMNEVLLNMNLPQWVLPIIASHVPYHKHIDFLGYGEPISFTEALSLGVIKRMFESEADMLQHVTSLVSSDAYGMLSKAHFGPNKLQIQSQL